MRLTARWEVTFRKAMFEMPRELRRADPAEFPGLNTRKYDELQAEFEAVGFTRIADIEDMSLARAGVFSPRAPSRYLLSSDGVVVAEVVQLRFNPLVRLLLTLFSGRNPFIVGLTTCFADGTALMLGRSASGHIMAEPPEIIVETISRSHSVADMLEAMAALRRERFPDAVPVAMHGLDDVLAMENRILALRREYRLREGLFTIEDARKQLRQTKSGKKMSPERIEKMARDQAKRMNKMLTGDPIWDPALRKE